MFLHVNCWKERYNATYLCINFDLYEPNSVRRQRFIDTQLEICQMFTCFLLNAWTSIRWKHFIGNLRIDGKKAGSRGWVEIPCEMVLVRERFLPIQVRENRFELSNEKASSCLWQSSVFSIPSHAVTCIFLSSFSLISSFVFIANCGECLWQVLFNAYNSN